jgi:uncharacterized OsmC-like protein
VRGIKVAPEAINATAEGTNELRDRIPVLTRIHVRYHLRLPEDAAPEKVERALITHVDKCPTAQSLKGAVEITWSLTEREIPSGSPGPAGAG